MDDKLHSLRHSAAHVMAQAVMDLLPGTKLGFGPAVEDGFYYDFQLPRALTPEDLPAIEARMKAIIKSKFPFQHTELDIEAARKQFADQPFKLDQVEALARGEMGEHGDTAAQAATSVSIYTHDSFVDLCRGPHVASTGDIPVDALKVMSIAGAYWRGDEKNPQLTRVYGTVFATKNELDEYLWQLEEAKKRDHRKLGKELEIFVLDEEVGPGLPLWLPNGGVLIEELEALAKETEREAGYVRVRTPHITKESLFLKSGHLPYYADSMYPPMELEGVRYYLKPMNCPMHHKIFASRQRSYRELPLRVAEYGTCYRYEKSGELFGLMRVRFMQMNDAHIYVPEELFEQEFMGVIALYIKYFKLFNIDKYVMRFSTHDKAGLGKKYVDNPALWEKTEEMVRRAMTNGNVNFVEVPGEAAFYGPKIDVQIWSAIGREFSLATNQVDFAQPLRFDLKFTNTNGQEEMPLVIHRAPLGTHERTIGFLLEHFAGAFPAWLAPVQMVVLPITDRHHAYANQVMARLKAENFRVTLDDRSERMNSKIRDAQLQKIPYILVVGDKEAEASAVAVRLRTGEDLKAIPIDQFIEMAKRLIQTRSLELK
ncbi:MAG: threonine--tRNA ligase [Chloroflexi bacterium]|nr:threonine--tRNA ligase [Chloroflexota bacterium]